jgi:uncharacterized protein (DUF342 family)
MAPPPEDEGLRVILASDGMSATVVVRPHFDPPMDPATEVRTALQQRDVAITAQVVAAIERLVESLEPDRGEDLEVVLAEGLPPVHGVRGRICFEPKVAALGRTPFFRAWVDDEDLEEAEAPAEAEAQAVADEAVDYRQKTSLLIIEEGDLIAHILPPELGADGVDVRGKVLACKQAQAFELSHDDSVELREDGSVYALQAGMLVEDGGKLKIERELNIRDNVDFNTGNIHFRGNVHVRKGVRDGFLVKVLGDLKVDGLIEAANIEVDGDAHFGRGMVGREKGTVAVGQSLRAHYLDSITGTVGRNLSVDKEMVHCHVTVGGSFLAGHATLIGGCVTVAGAVELKVLGSTSQASELRVGRVGELNDLLDETIALRQQLLEKLEVAQQEHDTFRNAIGKRAGAQADELTELVFKVQILESALGKLDKSIAETEARIARLAEVDVKVESLIHAKSILQVRRRTFTFKHQLKGPLRIIENEKGVPVVVDERANSVADLTNHAIEQGEEPLRQAS